MTHAKIQFWHDPFWPELETRSAHNSHTCYRMHSHRSHSFGCVDAGNTVLSFAHGHTLVLQAGDVLWLPATNKNKSICPLPIKHGVMGRVLRAWVLKKSAVYWYCLGVAAVWALNTR